MWEQTERIFLESSSRVVHAVARVLPGLLAMLLILVIAVALALALRAGVRRVCERIGLDDRLRQWGVAPPASEGYAGPSRVIARVVAWIVLVIGFVAGLSAIDAAATTMLALRLIDYVPHVVVAIVIFAVGIAGSRVAERSVLIAAVNNGFHSARLLGVGARWLVLVLSLAIAIENLGVGGQVLPVALGILFGGIVLALALAVGLGARDLVARSLAKHFPSGPHRVEKPPDQDRIQHL